MIYDTSEISPVLLFSAITRRVINDQWSSIETETLQQGDYSRFLLRAERYFKSEKPWTGSARELSRAIAYVEHRGVIEILLQVLFVSSVSFVGFELEKGTVSNTIIIAVAIAALIATLESVDSLQVRRRYRNVSGIVFSEADLSDADLAKIETAISTTLEGPITMRETERLEGDAPLSEDATLPAPPGLTEIVLENDSDKVFDEMRRHLTSVRRYHRIVLWILIIAFLAFLSAGLWKFVASLKTPSDFIQAFGSAGVGGMLLWFGQKSLWANRISQLSLALFESYVAEVKASLAEIPLAANPDERRKMRSEIWTTFRAGLNQIWLSEQEAVKTKN